MYYILNFIIITKKNLKSEIKERIICYYFRKFAIHIILIVDLILFPKKK